MKHLAPAAGLLAVLDRAASINRNGDQSRFDGKAPPDINPRL